MMSRRFEPGSKEAIDLIIESLEFAGIECRRVNDGEEGGIFYRDENGERKKFTQNIFVKRSLIFEKNMIDISIPLKKAECDFINDQADELVAHNVVQEEPQVFEEAVRASCPAGDQIDTKIDSIPGQEYFLIFDNALEAA